MKYFKVVDQFDHYYGSFDTFADAKSYVRHSRWTGALRIVPAND